MHFSLFVCLCTSAQNSVLTGQLFKHKFAFLWFTFPHSSTSGEKCSKPNFVFFVWCIFTHSAVVGDKLHKHSCVFFYSHTHVPTVQSVKVQGQQSLDCRVVTRACGDADPLSAILTLAERGRVLGSPMGVLVEEHTWVVVSASRGCANIVQLLWSLEYANISYTPRHSVEGVGQVGQVMFLRTSM